MTPIRALFQAMLCACLWWVAAAQVAAQEADEAVMTSLVADLVRVDANERLIATGNVEIFAQGGQLRASRLIYDRPSERLTIEGPIVLQDESGSIVLADQAALDTDLENGILEGARLVLRRQLQIAGAEMSRREGRFTDLKNVVASSCEVCAGSDRPLWEVRASRVIHDRDTAQIYFYNARFRIIGIPVFYLPTLRVPDGTNPRVNGFLTPELRSTSELGPGLKLPYFFTLGDHADITLTPYFSTGYTRTLEGRYRQVFTTGEIEFNGAISQDSILDGSTRGYLFAEGRFDLPRDFELGLDLRTTSDDNYLQDYDYSGADRLETSIGVLRTRRFERIEAEIIHYESLRRDDAADSPDYSFDGQWNRRLRVPGAAGWLDLDLIGHGQRAPDNVADQSDRARIRARANYAQTWTHASGLRFGVQGRLIGDVAYIADDPRFEESQFGGTPTAAMELSYPLAATGNSGVRYLLEPKAQVVYTARDSIESPNDDSTQTAFDSGNIFDLNRFPGLDRIEEGARANLALRWTRFAPSGWSLALTAGRVLRASDLNQFAPGTGLDGEASNWLAQTDIDFGNRLTFRNLTLTDDAFEPTNNQTRVTWAGRRLDLASSYVWQRQDSALDLDDDLSEIAIDAAVQITDSWAAGVDLRRDFIAKQTNRAELALIYSNECVSVDLSAIRRFRSEDNEDDVEPSTSFGLSVRLIGFGNNDRPSGSRRRCSR